MHVQDNDGGGQAEELLRQDRAEGRQLQFAVRDNKTPRRGAEVRGRGDALPRSALVGREVSRHDGGSSHQAARPEGRYIAGGGSREGLVHHGGSTKSEAHAIHGEQHIQADSYTGQLPWLEALRLEEEFL